MRGIVLAAGDGGRLQSVTRGVPKVLLEIGGSPLISYSLDALRSAGVTELAVVVGYKGDKTVDSLGEAYPQVTFIYNYQHHGGNAISIYAARNFVEDEPFIVCMGDHIISQGIIQDLLSETREGCVLCVDRFANLPSQVNDATRVLANYTGNISGIGKNLEEWNATDVGVFRMTNEVFPATDRLREMQGLEVSITDLVRFMGGNGHPFGTCDISGRFWADIDTPEDYQSVNDLLKESNGDRV